MTFDNLLCEVNFQHGGQISKNNSRWQKETSCLHSLLSRFCKTIHLSLEERNLMSRVYGFENASSVRSFFLRELKQNHWSQIVWHHFTQWKIVSSSNEKVSCPFMVLQRQIYQGKKRSSFHFALSYFEHKICKKSSVTFVGINAFHLPICTALEPVW